MHLVVKAEHELEPGRRLHITKPMLREWRERFAACLREQGVPANATPGCVRGKGRSAKKDPIHHRLRELARHEALPNASRANRSPPAPSTFMRAKVEAVARQLLAGGLEAEPGRATLVATRRAVIDDWRVVCEALRGQGEEALARDVESFVRALPPVSTDHERIAAGLIAKVERQRREATGPDAQPPPNRRTR